jgi:5-methylcytosine-specific restriction endonuclease McrA
MQTHSSVNGDSEVWFGDDTARPSWRAIDRNLQRIARRRAALDAEELPWLREALREEIWHELGMVSLNEYLEHRLGYGPRAAQERVRVALALDELPVLSEALASGEFPFTAIRELTRVVTAKTERVWHAAAQGKSVREIEEMVAGHERGDLPTDPVKPELRLRTLRFEVRPETFAKLRQVQQVLESEAGMPFDDDQLIASLCDAVLAPKDQAKHQLLVTICESCHQATQQGSGKRFSIGRAALELVECDAQRIDPVTKRAVQDITPRVRRFVWQRDGGRCALPACRSTRHLDVHHIVPREQGGGHAPENLVLLCSGHHRLLHDGELSIAGTPPQLEIRWARRERAHVDA